MFVKFTNRMIINRFKSHQKDLLCPETKEYIEATDTFLALYNLEFYQNAWLLLKEAKCEIMLPEIFLETQDHLLLFCGTFQI